MDIITIEIPDEIKSGDVKFISALESLIDEFNELNLATGEEMTRAIIYCLKKYENMQVALDQEVLGRKSIDRA